MKEKLSLLTELIKLARADNEIRKEEHDFLLSVARLLDISPEVFETLFDQYIEFTPPESEFDRILQFYRLVLLMNVDRETSEAEILFIKNSGIRIGLSPQATDRVLEEMFDYPDRAIPPEKLIEIFKEQHN